MALRTATGRRARRGGFTLIELIVVLTIIGTVLPLIFCCCIGAIPGIVGIVFSTQVNKLAAAGDVAGAQAKANTAKILGWVGIGLGALGLVVNVIMFATGNSSFYFRTN